tara:strand:- start:272 stop:628 length:357 start_codon:yes stop_codon:yes gene_type:complete
MTTSYILEAQQDLRELKIMERKAEALIRAQSDAKAEAKTEAARAWNASKNDRVNGIAPKPVEASAKVAPPAAAEMERARTDSGHFVADDPATPDVNEAYVLKKTATKPKAKAKARSKK